MAVRSFADATFVKQFVSEVHHAYQSQGLGMRSRVRTQLGVVGTDTNFPRMGALGKPQSKSIMDDVPLEEAAWDRVPCVLNTEYKGHIIDPDGPFFSNVDERAAVVRALASAFARRQDEIILNAAVTSTNPNNATSDDSWTTDNVVRQMLAVLGTNSVFQAGELWAAVTWNVWSSLLAIPSFVSADVGGDPQFVRSGFGAKLWYGFAFLPYELMPTVGTNSKAALFWQRNAIGYAEGHDFMIRTDFIAHKHHWLVTAKHRMGACLIDSTGVIVRRSAN